MLAALYESWSVPFAVLLSVPTGLFGAVVSEYALSYISAAMHNGQASSGFQDSVYMQIGIIMIIGLAAKNAILIVEFALVRTRRGMPVVKAALEAAGLRLRPILMTSFAFIIGCLPLAMASGAGSAARNSMGAAVVFGMLTATALGVFVIPVLFFIMEWIAFSNKNASVPQLILCDSKLIKFNRRARKLDGFFYRVIDGKALRC